MHDVKYRLEETFQSHFCSFFFTNFIEDLAEIGTASFIFKMKVVRASMTFCNRVSCLNLYLPCCKDTLQALDIWAVVHISLLHRVHMASVVIVHLLKLVGDGTVLCRSQTKGSKVSWHCHQRGPRKVLLNIVHPSCPLTLNLQLDSFGEGIGVIN